MRKAQSIMIAAMAFLPMKGLGGTCVGDSSSMRYLPRTIGRPNATIRTPFRMPCDTMEVRIGDTTTIYPGVMMHFGPTSRHDNIILVGGVLQVEGSTEAPVYFSGTLADGEFGLRPGKGEWGGFHVEPVGVLDLKLVRLFGAVPLLDAQSEKVRFEKVVTKNCLNIKGPDGKIIELEYKETHLDILDFRKQDQVHAEGVSRSVPAVQKKGSGLSKPLVWSLAGGGALLVGGATVFLLTRESETGPGPGPDPSKFPLKPTFPSDGNPH